MHRTLRVWRKVSGGADDKGAAKGSGKEADDEKRKPKGPSRKPRTRRSRRSRLRLPRSSKESGARSSVHQTMTSRSITLGSVTIAAEPAWSPEKVSTSS